MRSDRHYCRVYDDDLRRDYPAIWSDDHALSTWLRLLSLADKMWPTLPELPRSVKAAPLEMLTRSKLVELVPPHSYRIRGHDAERTARSNAGRTAVEVRWANARNTDRSTEVIPRRERDENETNTPPPPQAVGPRANGTNPRALGTNPRANGTSPRQERQAAKRAPTRLHEILTAIQKGDVE